LRGELLLIPMSNGLPRLVATISPGNFTLLRASANAPS